MCLKINKNERRTYFEVSSSSVIKNRIQYVTSLDLMRCSNKLDNLSNVNYLFIDLSFVTFYYKVILT